MKKGRRFNEHLTDMANVAKAKRKAKAAGVPEETRDKPQPWELDPSLLPKKPPGRA